MRNRRRTRMRRNRRRGRRKTYDVTQGEGRGWYRGALCTQALGRPQQSAWNNFLGNALLFAWSEVEASFKD